MGIYYVSKIIREAGGKTFLANPFSYKLENLKLFLDFLVKERLLDGIECYHPKNNREQTDFLLNYCEENQLLKSGGSDFHTASQKLRMANNGGIIIDDTIINDGINEVELI